MKKFAAVMLIAGVTLFAGCFGGKIQPNQNEVVGADWRTWGIINSYGTIEADGTSCDVCSVITNSKIDLYFDQEDQVLYDTLFFPRDLDDDELSNAMVTFEDAAENEDIDVILTTTDSMGEGFSWIWIYNADAGHFVFYSDNSNSQGAFPANYMDTWVAPYASGYYYYKLDELGSWYGWDERGAYSDSGDYTFDGENFYLYTRDTVDLVKTLYCYSDDMLVDEDGGMLTRESETPESGLEDYGNPNDENPVEFTGDFNEPYSDVVGVWEYKGYYKTPKFDDSYFCINADGTFEHYDEDRNLIEAGTYDAPEGDGYLTEMTLHFNEGYTQTVYVRFDSGYIIEDWNKYYLFRR